MNFPKVIYRARKRALLTVVFAVLIVTARFSNASAQSTFEFTTGAGYYELPYIGVNWSYSKKSSLGLYVGSNFDYHDRSRHSLGIVYSQIFIKPLIWKIQPGFSLKLQEWTSDDSDYYFTNMTFLFQASLNYAITNRIRIGIEGGGVLNFDVKSERKQNSNVGYPTRWNGNGCLNISYRLGINTKQP